MGHPNSLSLKDFWPQPSAALGIASAEKREPPHSGGHIFWSHSDPLFIGGRNREAWLSSSLGNSSEGTFKLQSCPRSCQTLSVVLPHFSSAATILPHTMHRCWFYLHSLINICALKSPHSPLPWESISQQATSSGQQREAKSTQTRNAKW